MRIARSIVIGGLLIVASSAAEAGWLGSGDKLPKPLNMLTVSRPYDPSHAHPAMREHKYNKPGWGAQWKLIFRKSPYHVHPYIRGY
jgi:hypothetical protein